MGISVKNHLVRNIVDQHKDGQLVYQGSLDGYRFSGQATYIRRLIDKLSVVLERNNRKIDELHILRSFSKRWYLLTSEGTPEVVLYYYSDASGFKNFLYVNGQKLKVADFFNLPVPEQDAILNAQTEPKPVEMWQKDRSIDIIGLAFEHMDKNAVDAAIAAMRPKILNDITSKDWTDVFGKLNRLKTSLKKVGTAASLELYSDIEKAFKKETIRTLLMHIKSKNFDPYVDRAVMLRGIERMRFAGYDWPELTIIEKELKKMTLDESTTVTYKALQ